MFWWQIWIPQLGSQRYLHNEDRETEDTSTNYREEKTMLMTNVVCSRDALGERGREGGKEKRKKQKREELCATWEFCGQSMAT